jgi:hypothetical protein
MFDRREPFELIHLGYTVLRGEGKSPSFKRSIVFPPGALCCVEYAVYFDYDIQHLYDLEHIWVYTDSRGKLIDGEASFHGRYFKILELSPVPEKGERLICYCQPGKHAFMPQGNFFRMLPDWFSACNISAGSNGLLAMDLYEGRIRTDGGIDARVGEYIKSRFAFEPGLEFEYREIDDSKVIPWPELFEIIPARVNAEKDRIMVGE